MRYISEQVRELREIAEMYDGMDGGDILREAADTIESLSSTLNKDEEKCRYKHAEVYHIGETVNKLHELCGEEIGWIHCGREIADSFQMINKLCGVIESLSAKLQAANMERSADCGGWIPCKERLPTKSGIYEISFKTREGSGHDFAEWRNGFFCIPADIIAWREHLEPYKPKQED